MLHLLAIAYHYYSELLKMTNKTSESEFCKAQYEMLQQTFHKLNPKASKIILHTPEMEKLSQEEVQLAKKELAKDENFS